MRADSHLADQGAYRLRVHLMAPPPQSLAEFCILSCTLHTLLVLYFYCTYCVCGFVLLPLGRRGKWIKHLRTSILMTLLPFLFMVVPKGNLALLCILCVPCWALLSCTVKLDTHQILKNKNKKMAPFSCNIRTAYVDCKESPEL